MKRNFSLIVGTTATIAAVLLAVTAVLAGPRLICKPIDIGSARSLPWSNPATLIGLADYDVKQLVGDTLALLNPATPVLVRMETLRRSAIYSQRDSAVASELVSKLHERAAANSGDALAQFDFGYLASCYSQLEWARTYGMTVWGRGEWHNPAAGIDGYAILKKAIALRNQDPAIEFAAALMTAEKSPNEHQEHLQKAKLGANHDPLLARNIASQFPDALTAKN